VEYAPDINRDPDGEFVEDPIQIRVLNRYELYGKYVREAENAGAKFYRKRFFTNGTTRMDLLIQIRIGVCAQPELGGPECLTASLK